MNMRCYGVIGLLLLVIAGGVYKFIFQGSVSGSTDGRTAIHLDAGERDMILAEMRAFLASVQQVTAGISENDLQRVAEHARKSGKAAQAAVPGTLVGKLPMQFKQLGLDTHTKFDQLAMDVEDLGDGNHALAQLSVLLQNCVGCHAAYRIVVSGK
jgi:mono/diheme cytochrome c family protein